MEWKQVFLYTNSIFLDEEKNPDGINLNNVNILKCNFSNAFLKQVLAQNKDQITTLEKYYFSEKEWQIEENVLLQNVFTIIQTVH